MSAKENNEAIGRYVAVAVSGSLSGKCGLIEPVVYDACRDAYHLVTSEDITAVRTRDELESFSEDGLVTLLDSEVPIQRHDLGVHVGPAFRERLSSFRLDHLLREFSNRSTVGQTDWIYFGRREELVAMLSELSGEILKEFDHEMDKKLVERSGETKVLLQLANLGIASAQQDAVLRWEHLVRYGALLQWEDDHEVYNRLRRYSVERVKGYSATEFDEQVKEKKELYLRRQKEGSSLPQIQSIVIFDERSGPKRFIDEQPGLGDYATPA